MSADTIKKARMTGKIITGRNALLIEASFLTRAHTLPDKNEARQVSSIRRAKRIKKNAEKTIRIFKSEPKVSEQKNDSAADTKPNRKPQTGKKADANTENVQTDKRSTRTINAGTPPYEKSKALKDSAKGLKYKTAARYKIIPKNIGAENKTDNLCRLSEARSFISRYLTHPFRNQCIISE